MKKLLCSLGIAIFVLLCMPAVTAQAIPAYDPGPGADLPGQNYSLVCTDGKTLGPASMKDKVTVMIFYQDNGTCSNCNATVQSIAGASWTGASTEVIAVPISTGTKASVEAYQSNYAPNSGIHFAYDVSGGGLNMMWRFLSGFGISSNVYTPVTIIMDGSNKMQYCAQGYLGESDLRCCVAKLTNAVEADQAEPLHVTGSFDYAQAAQVFTLTNQQRAANSAGTLRLDSELTEAAMQRAAEIAVYWGHDRPNGRSCFTVLEGITVTAAGENIAAGQKSAQEVMNAWMASEGHKENILSTDFNSIGVGCFYQNGVIYWVQVFGNKTTDSAVTATGVLTKTATVNTLYANIRPTSVAPDKSTIYLDETTGLTARFQNAAWGSGTVTAVPDGEIVGTDNTNVAVVQPDGSILGVGPGTVTVSVSAAGSGVYANCTVTVVSPFDAPVLKAAPSSDGSVRLSWNAVAGAEGYAVYRAGEFPDSYKLLGTLSGGSAVTYTDTATEKGTDYRYQVRAYGTVDGQQRYGTRSGELCIATAPAAPAAVTASGASTGSIKVTWSKVTGADGYAVYRAASPDGPFTLWNLFYGDTTTSCTNSRLTAGQTWYYKVQAYVYRQAITSRVYGEYSAVTSAEPLPAVPASFSAVSGGYNSVKLSWKAVTGADGYTVYRASSANGPFTAWNVFTGGGVTSCTNSRLTAGQTWYYKIRAFQTVNGSRVYGEYSAVKSAAALPAAPASFTAVSGGYNSVKLSWKAVAGADGYMVYRASSADGPFTAWNVFTGGVTSCTNSRLTAGQTWYYKIRAFQTVNGSRVYGSYAPVTSAAALPAAPADLTLSRTAAGGVKLSWKAVTGADGYTVYRAVDANGPFTAWNVFTGNAATSCVNSALTAGQTYYYKVCAYCLVNGSRVYGGGTFSDGIRIS